MMATPNNLFIILLPSLIHINFFVLPVIVNSQIICPPIRDTFPCFCSSDYEEYLSCGGEAVTSDNISRALQSLRLTNGVGINETLYLRTMEVTDTNLTELDLTPFLFSNFLYFYVTRNENLSRIIVEPPKNDQNESLSENHLITIYELHVTHNHVLSDDGLSQIFKFLAPTLQTLNLQHNNIQGSSYNPDLIDPSAHSPRAVVTEIEFFPGLSSFTQLKYLYLGYNDIRAIGDGQFRKNRMLRSLFLNRNAICLVDQNAFLIDHHGDDEPQNQIQERKQEQDDSLLVIDLSENELSDDVIHPSNGLDQLRGRLTRVFLHKNNFTFISAQNFETFLNMSRTVDNVQVFDNQLILHDNRFVCNEELGWLLKNGAIFLEKRVLGVDCLNDPGQTVFTTSLILPQLVDCVM